MCTAFILYLFTRLYNISSQEGGSAFFMAPRKVREMARVLYNATIVKKDGFANKCVKTNYTAMKAQWANIIGLWFRK